MEVGEEVGRSPGDGRFLGEVLMRVHERDVLQFSRETLSESDMALPSFSSGSPVRACWLVYPSRDRTKHTVSGVARAMKTRAAHVPSFGGPVVVPMGADAGAEAMFS